MTLTVDTVISSSRKHDYFNGQTWAREQHNFMKVRFFSYTGNLKNSYSRAIY